MIFIIELTLNKENNAGHCELQSIIPIGVLVTVLAAKQPHKISLELLEIASPFKAFLHYQGKSPARNDCIILLTAINVSRKGAKPQSIII